MSISRNVRIDEAADTIFLSAIFDWFRTDFETHAEAIGAGTTVLDWIAHYSEASQADALRAAKEAGYATDYNDYDWSLNRPIPSE
ncbi:MAG: hypothetical protein AAGF12_22800 [Myxococcota bacterium]